MAGALGVGARVFVGWCPDSHVHGPGDGRLKRGTLEAGPYEPGTILHFVNGPIKTGSRCWRVFIDGGCGPNMVCESLLSPLDDGDEVGSNMFRELEYVEP